MPSSSKLCLWCLALVTWGLGAPSSWASAPSVDTSVTAEPGPAETLAVDPLSTVHGLFPLWEHTGVVQRSGGFQVGYNNAHVAYGGAQVSTQPFLDIYGVLNLEAKWSLVSRERLKVAILAGLFRLPTNVQGRMLGNLNPTGFVNPYGPVFVAPLSLAKSVALGKRWALHLASTLLATYGEDRSVQYLAGGQAFLLEAVASPTWRARLHTGVEGLGVQAQAHTALSFAYQNEPLYLAAGAGQRLTFGGERSTFIMFDAGLVFP